MSYLATMLLKGLYLPCSLRFSLDTKRVRIYAQLIMRIMGLTLGWHVL